MADAKIGSATSSNWSKPAMVSCADMVFASVPPVAMAKL